MRFGGGAVHEILLKRSRNCSSIPASVCENPWEAFLSKSLLVDFSQVVIVPQLVVDGMKGGEKLLEGRNAQVLKGINLKEFREGFAYVSIVVP